MKTIIFLYAGLMSFTGLAVTVWSVRYIMSFWPGKATSERMAALWFIAFMLTATCALTRDAFDLVP